MPALHPITDEDRDRHASGTRWSGRYGKGETRIRRAVKREEAEGRNALHRTVIARIAADHNISEREARRIYAGRYAIEQAKAAKAALRAAERAPHAA